MFVWTAIEFNYYGYALCGMEFSCLGARACEAIHNFFVYLHMHQQ